MAFRTSVLGEPAVSVCLNLAGDNLLVLDSAFTGTKQP